MMMGVLFKTFSLLALLVICKGVQWELDPVGSHKVTICAGESVTFNAKIHTDQDLNNLSHTISWNHNGQVVTEGSHFSLVKTWNETSLTVRRALPCHVGSYDAYASFVDDDKNVFTDNATFELVVHDLFLNTLVKSPVEIKQGDNALLNVEKSTSGSLTWTRQGCFVRGEEDSHHIYLNSDKTELEIVAASPEMAGIYEVLLKQGNCEIRKAIEVQIKEDSEVSSDTTERWIVVHAVLGGLALIVVVIILWLRRRPRRKKSSKKEKDNVEIESTETHGALDEAVDSLDEDNYLLSLDPIYEEIRPITSSHTQSSTVSTHANVSVYHSEDYDTLNSTGSDDHIYDKIED